MFLYPRETEEKLTGLRTLLALHLNFAWLVTLNKISSWKLSSKLSSKEFGYVAAALLKINTNSVLGRLCGLRTRTSTVRSPNLRLWLLISHITANDDRPQSGLTAFYFVTEKRWLSETTIYQNSRARAVILPLCRPRQFCRCLEALRLTKRKH